MIAIFRVLRATTAVEEAWFWGLRARYDCGKGNLWLEERGIVLRNYCTVAVPHNTHDVDLVISICPIKTC